MSDARREQLSGWIDGSGIEIGALHRALWVPPSTRVWHVDRMPVEEQRRHYPELDGVPLAPVELVGAASELAVRAGAVDFVIANHLLEHLEDPIAALLEFERVLRPGGVLYLALPDHRGGFDGDRELTSVEHILREHDEGTKATRREHYLDWTRHVVKANPEDVESHADRLMADDYSIHFHCWEPDTFLEFFMAARAKVGLDFQVVGFAAPEVPDDIEFIVVLVKGRTGEVPLPPVPSTRARWRRKLAASPIGPPVRVVKRGLRALRPAR